MTMTIGADDGWSLDQSFPLLAQTWFSNIGYVQDTTPPPCLVLTSLADAQHRYVKGSMCGAASRPRSGRSMRCRG